MATAQTAFKADHRGRVATSHAKLAPRHRPGRAGWVRVRPRPPGPRSLLAGSVVDQVDRQRVIVMATVRSYAARHASRWAWKTAGQPSRSSERRPVRSGRPWPRTAHRTRAGRYAGAEPARPASGRRADDRGPGAQVGSTTSTRRCGSRGRASGTRSAAARPCTAGIPRRLGKCRDSGPPRAGWDRPRLLDQDRHLGAA